MTIKCINPRRTKPYADNEIDLTGPKGNPFFLMGLVKSTCLRNGLDPTAFLEEMMDDDYDHLVETTNIFFGQAVVLYRSRLDIERAVLKRKARIGLRRWRRKHQRDIVKSILTERFPDAFEVCTPNFHMQNEIAVRWTAGTPVEHVEAYLHSRLPIGLSSGDGPASVEYQGAVFRPIAATFEQVLANGIVKTPNPAITLTLAFHSHGVMGMAVARYREALRLRDPEATRMAIEAIRFLRNEGFDFCHDGWPQPLVDFLNTDEVLVLEGVALTPAVGHSCCRSRRI